MPLAVIEASPDLAIELDVPNREYNPGETITGRVLRRSHVVSPEALVSIKFYGRTKVRVDYTTNTGNGSQHHTVRTRFDLLSVNNTIFKGPIHIPPDGSRTESWPFSLSLPMGPVNPQAIREGAKKKQKYSFLPIDPPEQITSHPLPFTFYTKVGSFWANGIEAYVEYVLQAEFFEQHTSRFSSSPSAKKTASAVLPVALRPPPIPPLLPHEWRLNRWQKRQGVRTQRLIPAFAESEELSFKQKTLKLFHSSKVPKYSFDVLVLSPGVIQLGSVDPVPFRVAAVPKLGAADETSEEVRELERSPMVNVVSLKMVVKARTEVKVGSSWVADRFTDRTDTFFEWSWTWREGEEGMALPVWDRGLAAAAGATAGFGDEKKKMTEKEGLGSGGGEMSSAAVGSPEGEPPARDIGVELGLRFNPMELAYRGGSAKMSAILYPDFTTYNIRRTHELKWEMVLSVAKETVKVSNGHLVRFVAPWT
ncbi:hypothetical protein QBC32DRAFT_347754 [Pseudoneurospora amorphoporcata]|uniref:Arrestin-like N-terminal domain-containing protein n=1 Tax=Pseudoneurospora amorphoporcata TaxID=241081 RepID=A0AAN6SEH9_9PEZI|nr:hypothetical protein QBC32DRAFT_347754 [Pseudoneurospora amorphoporcata]